MTVEQPIPSKSGTLSTCIKRVAVFDTNAYRCLTYGQAVEESRGTARQLADAELVEGIRALANPFVIWELVSHLADPDDPAYENCQNALVALVEHTRLPEDSAGGVCRVADGETEPCRQLFGVAPPTAEANAQNLSNLASYVWMSAPDLSDSNAQVNFRVFKERMDELEANWLESMEALLDGLRSPGIAVPNSKGVPRTETKSKRAFLNGCRFANACAIGKVINLAGVTGMKLSEDELGSAAVRLQEIFPTSLKLMQTSVAKWFDAPKIDLRSLKRKRANFVWDTALCFVIGEDHRIGDADIVFVTDDKAIHEAAEAAGCSERVVQLEAYKANLPSISS